MISAGVPVLCMPYAFDQPMNAQLAHRSGTGPQPVDPKVCPPP